MQPLTKSKFFFDHVVTLTKRYIDFNDGADKSITLDLGYYSPTELCSEITKKMNAASSIDFTVTFNRSTQQFTIAGTSNFSLLVATGDNAGSSVFEMLGFTGTDRTGDDSYNSNLASGSTYVTQFPIQSFKHPNTNKKAIEPVLNVATSGVKELIKFGDESFLEGEIMYITDEVQETGSIIDSNPDSVSGIVSLLTFLTNKGHCEFLLDKDKPDDFMTLELTSTPSSPDGLDFDLVEMYDKGLPNFFRTGILKFKHIS